MSGSSKRFAESRYNEEGLRSGQNQSKQQRLQEKHLRTALKCKSFNIDEDDDYDDTNPHWLYQEDDNSR